MTSLNISLPEMMRVFVDEQVAFGGYGTASEYVRELIREDQKRKAQQRLETMLLQGLDSPASEWTSEDINHIKQAVRERLAQKHQNG